MKPLFDRLQWKPTMTPVLLVGAPEGFDPIDSGLPADAPVKVGLRGKGPFPFVLVFAQDKSELAERAPKAIQRAAEDGVVWIAYPKKTSRRFASDITRSDGWQPIGDLGFEPVRQVSVDDDWSALRFRRAEAIKSMTRSAKHALSAEGKRRAGNGKTGAKRSQGAARGKDATGEGLTAVYGRLRDLLMPHVDGLPNLTVGPSSLKADSRDTAPNGSPLEFVSVVTRSKSVNLYLMPINVNPELADNMPPGLAQRRQGKSCFNFPKVDEDRFRELEALVKASKQRWAKDGRL